MELETQAAFDPASFEHIPVLLNECLTGLAIDPAGTYLDGTAVGKAPGGIVQLVAGNAKIQQCTVDLFNAQLFQRLSRIAEVDLHHRSGQARQTL